MCLCNDAKIIANDKESCDDEEDDYGHGMHEIIVACICWGDAGVI